MIKKNREYLENGSILSLRFEYPDARSPKSLRINDDTRKLAVAYSGMTISEEAFMAVKKYD